MAGLSRFVVLALALSLAPVMASADTVVDRTIDRGSAKVLELEAGGAVIVLTPSSNLATINIRVDQDRAAPVPAMQSTPQGNRLAVTLKPPSGAPLLPFLPSNAARYNVTYPSDMRLDLRLSNGDVTVNRALAPIDLAADDGNVEASLASGWSGNEIRMQSATGTVRLAVPKGFRGKIDASSDSGVVHNTSGAANARAPFVWLYALKGYVFLSSPKS